MNAINLLVATGLTMLAAASDGDDRPYESFFGKVAPTNRVDFRLSNLNLENIDVDCSGFNAWTGFSAFHDGVIYYAGYSRNGGGIHAIDGNSGKDCGTVIHYGGGPNEMRGSIFAYCISPEGTHYFMDGNPALDVFSRNYKLLHHAEWYNSKHLENQSSRFDNTKFYIYPDAPVLRYHAGKLYASVDGGDLVSNVITPGYYKKTRIIEEFKADDYSIQRYLGRMSPAAEYMTGIWLTLFDIDPSGNFVVTYECDDMIYVYDKDFNLRYSFGQPGKDMDKNYTRQKLSKTTYDKIQAERKIKGHYTYLTCAGGYVFRGYATGNPKNQTRLQIYKGTTEIADIEVPTGFKVIGYKAPYFYSGLILDENKETAVLYRFKL
jgi:hypothetical protein